MAHADLAGDRLITTEVPARPVRHVLVPIVVLTLGFCAICSQILINAHRDAWSRAIDLATSLVAAVEMDTARNFESIDLSLQVVMDGLNRPDIDQISPELRQLILFDRTAAAGHLGGTVVLDEKGRIRFDSRTLDPQPVNYGQRDFFTAQRDTPAAGRYIGRPYVGMHGRDVIGISRRLEHPDGSFAGVVVRTLRLEYFQNLFKTISVDPRSSVSLVHMDGTVLMRWPYSVEALGKDIRHTPLFQHLASSRSSQFATEATSDGVHRLVVYRQVGDLPIAVAFGQASDAIFAQWRRQAMIVGLLMTALCVVTFALSGVLVRELGRRGAAERQLALLATTDELTGLSNRRHFRAVLQREWQRAMREQAPVSLLMIDVDLFKVYNDRYGHQAGDELLSVVAAAIGEKLKRAADVGARYGGDEFAVLLPGTPLAGAATVAEEIRGDCVRLLARREPHREHCPVSVGVACLIPELGGECSELIAAADEALYRAKANGRNRVDVAAGRPRQPAAVPAAASRRSEPAEAA